MDEKSMETETENPHNLRVIHRLLQQSSGTSTASPGGDSSPGSSSSGTSSLSGGESSNFRPINNNNNNTSLLNNNSSSNTTTSGRGSITSGSSDGSGREGFLQMQDLGRISGSPVGSVTGSGINLSDQANIRVMDDGGVGMSSGVKDIGGGGLASEAQKPSLRPSRACPSPVSSIVGNALNQLQLKRSSSAPMINQLGVGPNKVPETQDVTSSTVAPISQLASVSGNSSGGNNKDSCLDIDAVSFANSFLSSLGGPRPRRFSASFSPQGSPGPAPNRVSQLRQENVTDWETASEKEFHGTVGIAQSWEDLSLDSMSMEVGTRRPSFSDQLFLSMPPASSAPSSPAASPRVLSRFSPSLSSPSPTRKSFTTRRSLSPIAVRPSVLAIGQGVKRKCDWDSGNGSNNQMDCSPQPAKRAGGLLSFNPIGSPSGNQSISSAHNSHSGFNFSLSGGSHQQFFPGLHNQSHHAISPFNPTNSSAPTNTMISMITNHVEDSPYSNETESSVSSIGACDSPFFRPVDSPLASVTASPEDSPHPPQSKM